MITVPGAFQNTTLAREAGPGAAWLAELPSLVDELLDTWSCVPVGEVTHGGVGLIVPVRRCGGEAAVLKVSYPHPGNSSEPDALGAWRGRGAVLLHERDDRRFAMLLERVHLQQLAQVAEGDEVVMVAGRISRRLAVPAPAGMPRLQERAEGWEARLSADAAELGHPLAARVVAAAVATVRELGGCQPDTMIHGDLHARNILRADREPWLAVDPKGLAGDRAYDGGTLLKTRALALMEADDIARAARRVVDVFADAAELDRVRVRRWAQFHAVQTALKSRLGGFRIARDGPLLGRITAFADRLAEVLMDTPGV